jgi:AraC-like DNA-binding protein
MRLRPGTSRALFGVPISELVDRAVPVTDLWGAPGRRLVAELSADPGRAMSRLAGALPAIAAAPPATAGTCIAAPARHMPPVAATPLAPALRALESGASTPAAADRLGISERHLRTVFAREVGLSPKHFARIARLRRALSLAGDRGWAQLAGDLGYFDQAHLITEFRTLMGVSPGAFTAGRLPPVSPCGAR